MRTRSIAAMMISMVAFFLMTASVSHGGWFFKERPLDSLPKEYTHLVQACDRFNVRYVRNFPPELRVAFPEIETYTTVLPDILKQYLTLFSQASHLGKKIYTHTFDPVDKILARMDAATNLSATSEDAGPNFFKRQCYEPYPVHHIMPTPPNLSSSFVISSPYSEEGGDEYKKLIHSRTIVVLERIYAIFEGLKDISLQPKILINPYVYYCYDRSRYFLRDRRTLNRSIDTTMWSLKMTIDQLRQELPDISIPSYQEVQEEKDLYSPAKAQP